MSGQQDFRGRMRLGYFKLCLIGLEVCEVKLGGLKGEFELDMNSLSQVRSVLTICS